MRDKYLVRAMQSLIYEEKREFFESLGNAGHYSEEQKRFAFELISKHGIRATARILRIPRRTLQRWCKQYGVHVRRCPAWVFEWARRRRERLRFWQYKGYG